MEYELSEKNDVDEKDINDTEQEGKGKEKSSKADTETRN